MTDRNPEEKYQDLIKKGKTKIAQEYKERVIDELQGKHPEFARMSLGSKKNPDYRFQGGIGIGAIPDLVNVLHTEYGNHLMAELNDVPDMIEIGSKKVLLGAYLKNKLREKIGVTDEDKKKKMSILRQEKIQEYLTYRQELDTGEKALSQKEFLIDKHLQKVRDLEKRYSLKHTKGEL